jgi:hypothetical protein
MLIYVYTIQHPTAGVVLSLFCLNTIQGQKFLIFNRKQSLRRPRHRKNNNIKTDLIETQWEGVDWSHLAGGRIL